MSGAKNEPNMFNLVVQALAVVLLLQVLYKACLEAYKIRLHAIEEYGRVIHEFDPYFNYRATEVSTGEVRPQNLRIRRVVYLI